MKTELMTHWQLIELENTPGIKILDTEDTYSEVGEPLVLVTYRNTMQELAPDFGQPSGALFAKMAMAQTFSKHTKK
jgi:hypothetical protein